MVDDRWPQLEVVCGLEVIGNLDRLLELELSVAGGIAAVGNNALRKVWMGRIQAAGIELVSVVHPRAWVSSFARIGPGSAVLAMAVVGLDAQFGQGVIVNSGAVVGHDVCVDDLPTRGRCESGRWCSYRCCGLASSRLQRWLWC